jgi:hypothetical protein
VVSRLGSSAVSASAPVAALVASAPVAAVYAVPALSIIFDADIGGGV